MVVDFQNISFSQFCKITTYLATFKSSFEMKYLAIYSINYFLDAFKKAEEIKNSLYIIYTICISEIE